MTTRSKLPPDVLRDIEKFVVSAKNMKGPTSNTNLDIAKDAAEILRRTLSQTKGKDSSFQTMIQNVRDACRLMKEAYPYGPLISNVTRRVLYILRDEYQITRLEESKPHEQEDEHEDLALSTNDDKLARTFNPALDSQIASTIASAATALSQTERINFFQLKNNIMEHLTNNFMQDFDDVHKNIQKQAPEHIAEGEVILTYGYSQTVEKFLLFAAKKIKFKVIVCEAAPECKGHKLAQKLAENEVETTIIPDTLAYAYMARVSKVVLGTYLVVANGGLIAPAGSHGVAVAAQYHRVPVIVCTAMIKITPIYPSTTDLCEFGRLRDPSEILPYDAVLSAAGRGDPDNWVQVLNASVDYIPPELIALFITNDDLGCAYAPTYIYRLLLQLYNPEDSDL